MVSVSGTAFTSKHASSISKITKKVILLYDGDDAGGNAAIRAGLVLLKYGMVPSIVRPPDGLDPDDWIEQSSKANVLSAIQSPKEYIDFHIELYNGNELIGSDRQEYIINLSTNERGVGTCSLVPYCSRCKFGFRI